MSSPADVDDPQVRHDQKAGNSTFCRRGDHRTCTTLGARCTCSCHGRTPQAARAPDPSTPAPVRGTPKDRPIFKEPTVAEPANVTPIHAPRHVCDAADCGRVFDTDQGLLVHRARKHKPTAAPAKKPTAATPPPTAQPAKTTEAGPFIVGVTLGAKVETALFTSRPDGDAARGLLQALGHQPWMFRLEDGR